MFVGIDISVALVEENHLAVLGVLLESVEAADGLTGVTTQHKGKSVVCERLLYGVFELF